MVSGTKEVSYETNDTKRRRIGTGHENEQNKVTEATQSLIRSYTSSAGPSTKDLKTLVQEVPRTGVTDCGFSPEEIINLKQMFLVEEKQQGDSTKTTSDLQERDSGGPEEESKIEDEIWNFLSKESDLGGPEEESDTEDEIWNFLSGKESDLGGPEEESDTEDEIKNFLSKESDLGGPEEEGDTEDEIWYYLLEKEPNFEEFGEKKNELVSGERKTEGVSPEVKEQRNFIEFRKKTPKRFKKKEQRNFIEFDTMQTLPSPLKVKITKRFKAKGVSAEGVSPEVKEQRKFIKFRMKIAEEFKDKTDFINADFLERMKKSMRRMDGSNLSANLSALRAYVKLKLEPLNIEIPYDKKTKEHDEILYPDKDFDADFFKDLKELLEVEGSIPSDHLAILDELKKNVPKLQKIQKSFMKNDPEEYFDGYLKNIRTDLFLLEQHCLDNGFSVEDDKRRHVKTKLYKKGMISGWSLNGHKREQNCRVIVYKNARVTIKGGATDQLLKSLQEVGFLTLGNECDPSGSPPPPIQL